MGRVWRSQWLWARLWKVAKNVDNSPKRNAWWHVGGRLWWWKKFLSIIFGLIQVRRFANTSSHWNSVQEFFMDWTYCLLFANASPKQNSLEVFHINWGYCSPLPQSLPSSRFPVPFLEFRRLKAALTKLNFQIDYWNFKLKGKWYNHYIWWFYILNPEKTWNWQLGKMGVRGRDSKRP